MASPLAAGAFARRAILGGAVCLAILGAMLVRHAWPLWTGTTIFLQVQPVDPRELFRGDYVRLAYDLNRLSLPDGPSRTTTLASPESPTRRSSVQVVARGNWWETLQRTRAGWRMQDRMLYVQLQPDSGSRDGRPRHVAVSVSDEPVSGAVNLQGRVRSVALPVLTMDYGLDALYMQEGRAQAIADAIRNGQPVFAEIAVTRTGHARVKALWINGQRIGP